jgi:hypothetical protein
MIQKKHLSLYFVGILGKTNYSALSHFTVERAKQSLDNAATGRATAQLQPDA